MTLNGGCNLGLYIALCVFFRVQWVNLNESKSIQLAVEMSLIESLSSYADIIACL